MRRYVPSFDKIIWDFKESMRMLTAQVLIEDEQTHLTLENPHVNCKHTKWKVNRKPGSVKTISESFSALKGKLNRSV